MQCNAMAMCNLLLCVIMKNNLYSVSLLCSGASSMIDYDILKVALWSWKPNIAFHAHTFWGNFITWNFICIVVSHLGFSWKRFFWERTTNVWLDCKPMLCHLRFVNSISITIHRASIGPLTSKINCIPLYSVAWRNLFHRIILCIRTKWFSVSEIIEVTN